MSDTKEQQVSLSHMRSAIADASSRWRVLASKVRSSRATGWWWQTTQPQRVDWLLLGAILAVAYVTFLYGDVRATFEHSFNLLDSVLAGDPRGFYSRSLIHTSTGHPAVYDVPLYVIFALWNLPTYVIYKVTGFSYLTSTPAELWLKTMMVVAAVLAARQLAKLARDLGVSDTRSRWVAFYFLSSMAVFMPVFVVVQYDIILVLVMILGVRAYVAGNLKSFIGWFLLANTLKMFALFVFIPLLLLREKRLCVVFGQLCLGMIALALCRAFYHGDPGYQAATGGFTSVMLPRLTATSVPWIGAESGVAIPAFIVVIVAIAIAAFAITPANRDDLARKAVYCCMAVYLCFMVLVPLNPYWLVLLAPWAVLIIFLNPRWLVLNTLLETMISGLVVLLYTRVGYSMYNADLFKQLLLPHVIPGAEHPRFTTPRDALAAVGLGGGNSILVGLLVACSIAFLILNYPRPDQWGHSVNEERMPRSIAWLRLVAPVSFAGLLLVTYFVPAVPTVYSSADGELTDGSVNLFTREASVEQELQLNATTDVRELAIGFDAVNVSWLDSSLLTVQVADHAGHTLMSQEVPTNSIQTGFTTIKTNGLVLNKGESYTVKILGAERANADLRVRLSTASDQGQTRENGKDVSGDVAMIVSGHPR